MKRDHEMGQIIFSNMIINWATHILIPIAETYSKIFFK
jgi:hypothetical protein